MYICYSMQIAWMKNGYLRMIYILYKYVVLCVLLALPLNMLYSQVQDNEQVTSSGSGWVSKSIYKDDNSQHGGCYNWLWGKHYRDLYYKPVTVGTLSGTSLIKDLKFNLYIPKLKSAAFSDTAGNLYLFKPLEASASFLESDFFMSVYDPKVYANTYTGDFITDAYTIQHPYMFLVSSHLAKSLGLFSGEPYVYYISKSDISGLSKDSLHFDDKITGVYKYPHIEPVEVLDSIPQLLGRLHEGGKYKVDTKLYIRTRLFDMLIGDWNKNEQNWGWIGSEQGDTTIYQPVVLDRGYAFSKVDGHVFPTLLGMLGLGFIKNYDEKTNNIKKLNELGYPLDVALIAGTDVDDWLEGASYIQRNLTDNLIDESFNLLPKELKTKDSEYLQKILKERRTSLKTIVHKYYEEVQKVPSVAGSNGDDRFVLDYDEQKNLRIRIFYPKDASEPFYDRTFKHKETKELWLYSLVGDDSFEVNGYAKGIRVFLIGGNGTNKYDIENHTRKLRVYEAPSEKERLKSLENAKVRYPSNTESSLGYDYKKLKYNQFSVTPIGIYDSDLGVNLGTSVSYTVYGFRRAPYSQRHQLSFDYVNGVTYQGIFPDYDGRKSFHLSAYVGSPAYFSNFFGFGNSTAGFKHKQKKYNRVNIEKYSIAPALYYNPDEYSEFNVTSSFDLNRVHNPEGRNRYINEVYDDGSSIFDYKYFMNLSATYKFDKRFDHFLSRFNSLLTLGWNMNIGDVKRNYPYMNAELALHFRIIDRVILATQMKGKMIFNDKYEFYQSATTELRGFRNNRFIGKQSFYQYTDIRFDMGELKNPFTPLKYGVFAGVDYGRVWYPGEKSKQWHSSYGGGFWLTLLQKYTGKFSYFASKDDGRFMLELGMGF